MTPPEFMPESTSRLESLVLAERAALFAPVARRMRHDLANIQMVMTYALPRARPEDEDQLGRMLRILHRMARSPEIDPQPLVPHELADEVQEWLQTRIATAPVVFHLRLEPGLPAVCGRATYVFQALLGACVWALEAAEGAGTRLAVCVDGNFVRFEVTHDGSGQAADATAAALSADDAAHETTSPRDRRLAVVRGLVEREGGRLVMTSMPGGRGASAALLLPAWER